MFVNEPATLHTLHDWIWLPDRQEKMIVAVSFEGGDFRDFDGGAAKLARAYEEGEFGESS